jgi:hypothetical protein
MLLKTAISLATIMFFLSPASLGENTSELGVFKVNCEIHGGGGEIIVTTMIPGITAEISHMKHNEAVFKGPKAKLYLNRKESMGVLLPKAEQHDRIRVKFENDGIYIEDVYTECISQN